MNLFGNKTKKSLIRKFLLAGLSALCCGAINGLSFLSASSLSNISEVVANHISVLAKKDALKRANISISDESGLLSINKYHVCMMSYIGKNNSVFATYSELSDNTICKNDQESTIKNVNIYGLTNYGDGYVYGTTDIPYGITVIEGDYSPTSPLLSDVSSVNGCVISESIKNKLFPKEENVIGQTILFNSNDINAEFYIVAVAKDSCLCNSFTESPFILANFVTLQRLNKGRCCLKLRLKDNYYTNYSIFHTLFSKIYINGYSTNKLSLDFGDERLNTFVYSTITKDSNQKNMSFLVAVSFLLEILNALAFLLLLLKAKIKVSKMDVIIVAFGSVLFSYIFAFCLNHIFLNYTYINTMSSINTIVSIANVSIFVTGFLLLSRFIKGKKSITNDNYCCVDI